MQLIILCLALPWVIRLSSCSSPGLEPALDAEVAGFVQQAYSSNTQSAYATHRKSYLSFCYVMGYTTVPAMTEVLIRHAAVLARSLKYQSIKQYLNIVRILHAEWNLDNPMTNNYQMQCVMCGIRRSRGDTQSYKAPITPDLLLKILQADTAFWAALLLMFYGMLRVGSVLCKGRQCTHERHIVCSDISFSKYILNVVIRASKTIQFADRKLQLPIPGAKPWNVLCPVQAMLLYVQGAQSRESNDPLFITSDGRMRRPLTATVFAQRLKSVLSSLGVNAQSYATHFCRRGGASWAYRLDDPVDTIKVIGDWRSLAYQRYIVTERPLITHAMQRMVDGVALTR